MKRMNLAEIRNAFLNFYKQHGHEHVASSSLIPVNDPTLLFTSAGMVQFKDVFTGIEKRAYIRATTAQRCLRAGGKHNDLENVGYTARHHTFFEMMGNFSFGDYFKHEAIRYAWDFVTNVLQLPKDRLYVTIHISDDEAFKIWTEQEKVPAERIYRFDKDNFWSAGDVGPCGPCTEIFFDRGERYNTGDPEKDKMGGDGDRFMEFYNLVFMQFERDEQGNMRPLPKPSVDTGMGLERTASIVQDVDSNYDIDLFKNIFTAIKAASPMKEPSLKTPKEKLEFKVATQVVADHLRAVTFLIADGLLPSNEGRGYVLRRILRRAVRYGKKLGFEAPFLNALVNVLVREMGDAYPVIREKQGLVERIVKSEEEKFFSTLGRGLQILNEEIAKLPAKGMLPGKTAFLLYDSFGFPFDLTQVIAREHGLSVDERGFEEQMSHQKSLSKVVKDIKDADLEAIYKEFEREKLSTRFSGYEKLEDEGRVTALIQDGKRVPLALAKGDGAKVQLVFDRSPFYAEGGGQVGDQGEIFSGKTKIAEVLDVKKALGELSIVHAELLPGQEIKVGNPYRLAVPRPRRAKTAANHSATHLLHWALHEVLGDHVKQAGSLVNDELLRFDFTHFQGITPAELDRVENMVNAKISEANPVGAQVMKKDAAIEAGAIALFGEKYGDEVRVLKIGDFSTELCGGVHVHNTSEIRMFKIVSEAGIAAGTRRIIAYTSDAAFDLLRSKACALDFLRGQLKVQSEQEVLERVERMQASLRDLEKRLEKAEAKNTAREAESIVKQAKQVGSISLLAHRMEGGMALARSLAEHARQHMPSGIIAIAAADGDKAILIVNVSKDLTSKWNAGKIIQEIAPLIGGKGGGKPDSAQAGGANIAGLPEALAKVKQIVSAAAQS